MTGGSIDWGQQVDVKHYKKSDGDKAMRDLGITTDAPLELDLDFWTRPPGTIGMAVQALGDRRGRELARESRWLRAHPAMRRRSRSRLMRSSSLP